MRILTLIVFIIAFLVGFVGLLTAHAQVIFEADFESGTFSGFGNVQYDSTVSISTDRAHSGKYSAKLDYPEGVNESAAKLSLPFNLVYGKKALFIRFYRYFEPNFDFPEGLKMFRFSNEKGPLVGMELKWRNGSLNLSSAPKGYTSTKIVDGKVAVGVWQCYEAQITLNDIGQTNGILRIWLDGDLRAENTSMTLIYADMQEPWFRGAWVGGNYSDAVSAGGTGGPLVESIVYLDDVVVSTQRVGCLPSTGDKTPPNAPEGLRISGQ